MLNLVTTISLFSEPFSNNYISFDRTRNILGIDIYAMDEESLEEGQWVTDNVINALLK